MMKNPRAIIAQVAREYLGTKETSTNRGPHLAEFWAKTSYPSGATDRQPWCSAFATFCAVEGDRRSPELALRVPPTFPAVAQWLPWARDPKNGCLIFTSADVAQGKQAPMAGDIVIFLPRLSHIGIVAQDYHGTGPVATIEGNTNAAGSREGDGVWVKSRALNFCGSFIRIPAVGKEAA
jgi:hypothetical protein